MKTSIFKSIIISVISVVALNACSNGKDGAQGPAGQDGGKVVATMNCLGIISGLSGASSALNGLEIKYNAVLTSSGDVYATASVADDFSQQSSTEFYAAGQAGANTADVEIIADYHSTADAGVWNVSLNRSTLVTTVQYDDDSLPAVVSLDFSAAACTQTYW